MKIPITLGRPIPPKSQRPIDFDPNGLEDYEFKFEIGMAPDFEIIGADDSTTCDFYKVEVPEEKVDEQIDLLKKQRGERIEIEDGIIEEDVISLKAKELEDGAVKAEGLGNDFFNYYYPFGRRFQGRAFDQEKRRYSPIQYL